MFLERRTDYRGCGIRTTKNYLSTTRIVLHDTVQNKCII